MATASKSYMMSYYHISDEELENILKDMQLKAYPFWLSGDILIQYLEHEKVYEVFRIAERREYDKDLKEIYRSVNTNYETTISKG